MGTKSDMAAIMSSQMHQVPMASSIAEVEQVRHHPLDLDTEYLNLMPSCSS